MVCRCRWPLLRRPRDNSCIVRSTLRSQPCLAGIGVSARAHREAGRSGGDDSAFLCFQRRTDEDLVVSGYKVLGSAQRRSRRAVLQHGSLLLKASCHAPELPGVFELTSKQIDPLELVEPIAKSVGQLLSLQWDLGQLSDRERDRGHQIAARRFGNQAWNHRR